MLGTSGWSPPQPVESYSRQIGVRMEGSPSGPDESRHIRPPLEIENSTVGCTASSRRDRRAGADPSGSNDADQRSRVSRVRTAASGPHQSASGHLEARWWAGAGARSGCTGGMNRRGSPSPDIRSVSCRSLCGTWPGIRAGHLAKAESGYKTPVRSFRAWSPAQPNQKAARSIGRGHTRPRCRRYVGDGPPCPPARSPARSPDPTYSLETTRSLSVSTVAQRRRNVDAFLPSIVTKKSQAQPRASLCSSSAI